MNTKYIIIIFYQMLLHQATSYHSLIIDHSWDFVSSQCSSLLLGMDPLYSKAKYGITGMRKTKLWAKVDNYSRNKNKSFNSTIYTTPLPSHSLYPEIAATIFHTL